MCYFHLCRISGRSNYPLPELKADIILPHARYFNVNCARFLGPEALPEVQWTRASAFIDDGNSTVGFIVIECSLLIIALCARKELHGF